MAINITLSVSSSYFSPPPLQSCLGPPLPPCHSSRVYICCLLYLSSCSFRAEVLFSPPSPGKVCKFHIFSEIFPGLLIENLSHLPTHTHTHTHTHIHTFTSFPPFLLYLYLEHIDIYCISFLYLFTRFLPYVHIRSVKTGIFLCSVPLLNPQLLKQYRGITGAQ